MESDILLIQLWVPTAAVGASGRGSSAAVHCARLRMGDRPRSGKILRSSQSRQTDGPNCQARRGQAAAEAPRTGDTVLFAMRTTVTFTSVANARVSG